jgi:hypothetical protein
MKTRGLEEYYTVHLTEASLWHDGPGPVPRLPHRHPSPSASQFLTVFTVFKNRFASPCPAWQDLGMYIVLFDELKCHLCFLSIEKKLRIYTVPDKGQFYEHIGASHLEAEISHEDWEIAHHFQELLWKFPLLVLARIYVHSGIWLIFWNNLYRLWLLILTSVEENKFS